MKKVKTLLVSAIAALSLSACSLQDAIDWTKDAGGNVAGFFTGLLEKVGLKKADEQKEEKKEEEKSCNHEDKNHDGTCDLCGVSGLEVVHSDENHDHNCDVCGAAISEHVDADSDFKCDECGKDLEIVSVRLDLENAQINFAKGEEFSDSGVKVIARSEVGSEKELEFSTSEPDMTQLGDQTVVVTYGEGENDKLEYEINISYWSEDDLDIFEQASLLGYAPLPYLAGYNMRVEVSENNDSWWIEADDITAEAYLDYNNMLLNWEEVVEIRTNDVTFALTQIPVKDAEGYHGLSEVQVFDLIPSYIDPDGYPSRKFVMDEVFVVGINSEGSLIIESRKVNAMLDGLFGDEILDGTTVYYASKLNPYFSKILEWYYSELSAEAFIAPEVSNEAGVTCVNLQTYFPLEEVYDQFDLAWHLEYPFSTEEEYNAYVAELLAAGYEKTEYQSGAVSYVLDDELYGYLELFVSFEEDLGTLTDGSSFDGIVLEFYYVAPESYTNHLTLQALAFEEILNIEFSVDNDLYEDYGVVFASSSIEEGQFTSGEEVAIAVARELLEWGFDVIEAVEYDDDYEQYTFEVTNGYADCTFWVDAEPEDGYYGLEILISDASGFELSNAEVALQEAYFAFTNTLALYGVDYVENDDESFTVTLVVAEDATEAYLQAGAEGIGQVLPASFELASSAAGEEAGTWVAVFNDVENNVQIVSVSYLDSDSNLICEATFSNHRFVTPETTMVDFLTAHNGSAPSESDYEVAQDGSCMAEIAFSGEHAAADLQGLAEGLGEELGEAFVKVSSEADGEDWVAIYDNETTGIRVTILVSLEDSSASALVETSLIPEPVVYVSPEEAAYIVGYAFGKTGTLQNDGSYFFGGAYAASALDTETAKYYLTVNLQYYPEFVQVMPWTAGQFNDGTAYERTVYMNEGGTVIDIIVYSDNYGTEEEPVPVTCFQVSTYLY